MSQEKVERSLIIIKPDAIQRSLAGEIISRFERKGLKIIGLKMLKASETLLEQHYEHIADKPFFAGIKKFMMHSPVIAMAVEGIRAVDAIRIIVGPTKGYEADAGSIRGDFTLSIQSNVVHASDSVEAGAAEVARFFADEEIFSYPKVTDVMVFADDLLE
ncbi:MAG: nucleoside-diphosphate kinase [Candidatus Pacebacteria bacterium]|nr:nucleoside-diphosphate kinase [Candidatus Paceibacterota bacterium]MCD8507991.1 nucleoside-diphosphate kinase [Candidatus Paceibacterota bacterium]MCD8528080.1 nucleoside-diphosphate kinase [Candidatus Paceibacterota bacterium]MCD8564037.1 nucleoside-diphosphate kinase [Candidatus Paceibacterota bacterium]